MASLPASSAPGTIVVLAFAGARDVVGEPEVTLALADLDRPDGCTAGEVMDAMVARYPELGDKRSIIRLAVNGSYVENDAAVNAGDEVALIPPVAGG